MGYLIPKPFLWKNSIVTIYPIARGIRVFTPFSRVTCLKVNIIAQLEFELSFYDFAVQHFSHYTMGTPSHVKS